MYHSITIGEKNTWDDWKLIPLSRPLINPPAVNRKLVEIPGYDGAIDITTVINGRPTFGRRTGDWKFIVTHDYEEYNWVEVYSDIMDYLQTAIDFEIVLEDDPDFIYTGSVWVQAWESGRSYSTITLSYDVQPYKAEVTGYVKRL